MLLTRRNLGKKEEGFSLPELLVVILILGVLAAIAMGLYNESKRYAVRAGVYQDVKHTELEVMSWLAREKPVLGSAANGGQRISISRMGNDPVIDNTSGPQIYSAAGKIDITVSDPKTSIVVTIDGGLSTPAAGNYDVTFVVRNNTVGGLLSYHPGQGGRTSGIGLLEEGWK